ncbi:MAG: SDR family oxidoreductase [Aromatoleum sp.]|jgi:NAD(P)-dependent dehydrogenase (short-subunit alcohol dehydrogenase family)|uniref:SDR family oxidoreductase n=1 Tax=Aromatoleum sp. TaxID=2307007 RepID=UPI00289490C5|nr:SDR family oxidoreductase [Aromatoleum sp.]MDT3671028.1 SDR family oxidoreductase [Aromatoleum sp.]
MSRKLEGKVAIVLGAAGRDNMGQVIAKRFADEGARVVVAGRHLEELSRFAATIGGAARSCDITKKSEVAALFAFAKDWGGRVDVALNATGWGLLKPFTETTEDEIDRITDLQFKGPFYFCQAAVDTLSRGGSIIQISSATATIMLNDHAAYMGTKAGTDHVIRCVAHEFGERGIRANSISPGLTDTPMTAEAKDVPGLFDSFLSGYPLGRIGTKDDIAAAAVWLASDECFMTGQNLQVNGGLTLRRNPTREEIQGAIAAASAPAAA